MEPFDLLNILLTVRSWDITQVYRWSVAVNLPIYHPLISRTIVLNFKKVFDSSPGQKINYFHAGHEDITMTGERRDTSGVRAFVAIDLSPKVREKMGEVQYAIRQSRARLNLVDPSIIHITIKFLGEIDATRVGPVSEALREIRFSPFDLFISGISTNNDRNPRVVWGTIGDRGECMRLFEQVETALMAIGFPREVRGFTPHATIARVKESDPSLMQAIRPYRSENLGECHISGFTLKKSTLTPTGPIYNTMAEVVW